MGSIKDLLGDVPYVSQPQPSNGIPQEVYAHFERLALEIKRAGFRHYSADAILHRIRWHFHIEKGQRDFKCNNNWTSDLARWFLKIHPELDGFFELRRSPLKNLGGAAHEN